MMKTMSYAAFAAMIALGAASAARASCYADYKAKRNDPLRLHYGVIELSEADCRKDVAGSVIARRIAADSWQLLAVLSLFGPEGLEQRREQAGPFFLKY